jgi:FtsH-binding integral membrane protein
LCPVLHGLSVSLCYGLLDRITDEPHISGMTNDELIILATLGPALAIFFLMIGTTGWSSKSDWRATARFLIIIAFGILMVISLFVALNTRPSPCRSLGAGATSGDC